MEPISDFELTVWEKDAAHLVTCTGCYGSGEDRWNEGRACPTCVGTGRAPREPHVTRLIAEVRKWRAGAEP